MKVKTKLCAAVLAVALGCGVIAGCNANGGSKNPSSGGQPDSGQQQDTKYLVNVSQSSDYTISGIASDGYLAGAKVSFTVTAASGKEIVSVGYDQVDITPKADGSYEFNMPEKNVTLIVSVKAIETYALTHTGSVQIDGDPITFTLKLGNDPVTGYRLEEAAGADKVDIDGVQVTGKEAGETTIIAYIGNEEKARETITVEASAYMTIGDAIADAWANTTNFSDNSKSTKTTNKYKMRAEVVFMGNVYSGKVEMLLDDGTGILDYQITSSSNITAFKVGDVIEVEEVLQNYYGLIEIFSSDVKYAKKVEGVTIPETAFQDATNGTKFDAIYDSNITNAGLHKVTPVNLQAKATGNANRFEVPGATKGLLATTKSVITLAQEKDAVYNFKGYLLNWNSSSSYSNFIAIEQTKLAANSVQINEADFELALSGSNTKQLSYTTDPVGAGISVAWSVAPSGVVTVSETGLVTAVATGNAVITLTVDGKTDTVNVSVVDRVDPATSVSLAPTSLSLETGETEDLVATVTPANTTDEPQWSVSPEGVVTLTQDAANKGKVEVKAVAAGSATITVKYNDSVSATCPVTVTAKHGTAESDPLTPDEAYTIGAALKGVSSQSVYTDEVYFVKGIYTASAAPASQKITADYAIGDKVGLYNTKITDAVASKFEKGSEVIVKGQICNYSNGYKIQFSSQAEVISADNSKATLISISGDSSVAAGSTITLTANVFPASLNAAATFSTEDTAVATVTAAGVVSGVAPGTATIKAQYQEIVATHVVSVTSASAITVTKTIAQVSGTTTNGTQVASLTLDSVITVSVNADGNNGKVYSGGTEWRLYQTNTPVVTVAAASGYALSSVTFTYTVSNTATFKYGDTVISSDSPVTVSGSSAQFTVGNSGGATNGQVKVTAISVTYEAVA